MTLTEGLLLLPVVVYILWSVAKIIRLLREAAALQLENDRLTWWLRKYDGIQPRIALTIPEKKLILNALECDTYKQRITEPATKRFIRNIYNTLVTKLKEYTV